MQETWVRSLGLEDPLKEGMATHSSILAGKIPRTEEPGGLQSIGLQRVRHTDTAQQPNTEHYLDLMLHIQCPGVQYKKILLFLLPSVNIC